MGDPKKQRKKYSTPSHPWQKEQITKEKELLKLYGMKNKTEIWKMDSILTKFSRQAKKIIASHSAQSEFEKKQLLSKAISLDLIEEGSVVEDILEIDIKKLLERRLQTIVTKKGFSKSIRQARQFICHNHIMVKGKLITSPSYLVAKEDEDFVTFSPLSLLSNQDHPERVLSKKQEEEKKKVEAIKTKK